MISTETEVEVLLKKFHHTRATSQRRCRTNSKARKLKSKGVSKKVSLIVRVLGRAG